MKKHILLALCGKTPQIITETLYSLIVNKQIPIEKVIIITTKPGLELIHQKILSYPGGEYYKFCTDYNLNPSDIDFTNDNIFVAHEFDNPDKHLDDIESLNDSESMGNLITRVVYEKTRDKNTVLHCSLAAGRKTMSAYLAMALQYLGRYDDRLYHVLVSPAEFENNAQFFYPTPVTKMIETHNDTRIDAQKAKCILAELPYVHFRGHIDLTLLEMTFSELVNKTQKWLECINTFPPMLVNKKLHCLTIGNDFQVHLPDFLFAVYLFFALRNVNSINNTYESYFIRGGNNFEKNYQNTILQLWNKPDKIVEWEKVQEGISKINKRIRNVLQNEQLCERYFIEIVGSYHSRIYGIKLDKNLIKIV